MTAKMSVFVVCVEAIIHLLLYNLNDCTFKYGPILSILESTINFISGVVLLFINVSQMYRVERSLFYLFMKLCLILQKIF